MQGNAELLSISSNDSIWNSDNEGERDFISVILGENGILLPKLFWTSVRKDCSSNGEKL